MAGGSITASPFWLAIPFIVLLLLIAIGLLFFADFWHRPYPNISIILATFIMGYYYIALENKNKPVEAVAEYIQFISLITALYIATSGVSIKVDTSVTPLTNMVVLFIGALLDNLIVCNWCFYALYTPLL